MPITHSISTLYFYQPFIIFGLFVEADFAPVMLLIL